MTTPPPPPPLFLLDTNILLALMRGGDLGTFIDTTFKLSAQPQRPLICVVTVGEIWTLASRNNWGAAKRAALTQMIQNLVVVDIVNNGPVVQAYVAVEDACTAARRVMGKNDVWIAAVANVTKAHLLTTDQDFNFMNGTLLQVTYIDPASKLPPAPAPPPPPPPPPLGK